MELLKYVKELKRKICLVVARGLIHSVDDEYQAQASFLYNEPKDKTDIIQQYGFTSKPLKDSECIGICPGNRENMVIIATDDKRYRPNVNPGEVSIYSHEGDKIHLKKGNKITIETNNLSIKNQNYELVSIIYDVIEGLETAVTATAAGPQPLSTKLVFSSAKAKIKTFMD